jgi:hypothetical protein
VSRQTARFLKALNDVVGAQGSGGRIVLLSHAVVSGELPDITVEVRAQVYARVSRPIPALGTLRWLRRLLLAMWRARCANLWAARRHCGGWG